MTFEFPAVSEIITALLTNSRGGNAAALVLASFVLYLAAAQLAWRSARAPASSPLARFAAARYAPALYAAARLVYYLGIPFLALYLGWVDLRAMGLSLLDWAEGVRWAIVILLAAWLLLMWIWLPYLRATLETPAPPGTRQSFARRLVELVYLQAHWAFYRAGVIVCLTGIIADALYWGAAVGLGLTLLEAVLNPGIRARLARIAAADQPVWNMSQALLNALAFLVTRNLFLLGVIHFLLELTVPHLRATRPRPRAAPMPAATRQSATPGE